MRMLQTFFLCIAFCLFLSGCASSDVQRNAAASMDMGFRNATNLVGGAGGSSIADSYQNINQATKGVILGGAAGGVTGVFVSGVGFVPGAAVGAVIGGSIGSYIDVNTSMRDQLENRGVNIIILGDQILLVIPSSRIFRRMSAYIKPSAYSTLNLVAVFINQYTKILVKISGYTADTASNSLDFALSQQQAAAMEKFLLLAGIDARLLYACGYGGTKLVTRNSLDWNSDNYRIEITLEKLYV